MALLRDRQSGKQHSLASRCLVGRAWTCDLRLASRDVSAEHASLFWNGDKWLVRDLWSRNGTWVGGELLTSNRAAFLERGARIAFGSPQNAWDLVDASAPTAHAEPLDGGELASAEGGILLLPDAERPEVSVFQDELDGWVVETSETREPIANLARVEAGGHLYSILLPKVLEATNDHSLGGPSVHNIGLSFSVSRDEEYVELCFDYRGSRTTLPSRAHTYTLLTLARIRLADIGRDRLPAGERGWIHRDELGQQLKLDPFTINAHVSRARRQLGAAGVSGAAGIVERRMGTGALRIGIDRLEVSSL